MKRAILLLLLSSMSVPSGAQSVKISGGVTLGPTATSSGEAPLTFNPPLVRAVNAISLDLSAYYTTSAAATALALKLDKTAATGAGSRVVSAASVPADGCGQWLSGNMTSTGAACPVSGGGLADPGGNGILKRTALNTTGAATQADVQGLLGTGGVRTTEASSGLRTQQATMTLFTPATTDRVLLLESSIAVTVTSVRCQVDAGTSVTLNLEKRAWNSMTSSGTAVLTSSYVATASSTAATTFSSAAIPAHTPVVLVPSAVSGTVGVLWCTVEYSKDTAQ